MTFKKGDKVKYTEKDIKEGTKLRCVSTIEPYWWKVGKQYEVEKSTDGLFILKDETGYIWNRWLILDFLNGKAHCKMEIVEEEKEMEYTEEDLYEGMRLLCNDEVEVSWWTTGKEYKVIKSVSKLDVDKFGPYYIYDNDGDKRDTYSTILNGLNDKKAPVIFEVVEEEKEMKKYVEVTKLIDWSRDPELLEVGKVYKVAEEYKDMLYIKGVSIYINEGEPSYYLRSDQFKYVDEPVVEIKVDTLEVIEAKIEQLAKEQTNLYNKRMRIKEQEESLREKRMKLKEAKKSLEFLKKQNYL